METSQSLMVLSVLPETRVWPSGLKEMEVTASVWPVRVRSVLPVEIWHPLLCQRRDAGGSESGAVGSEGE